MSLFESIIRDYLQKKASEDAIFGEKYAQRCAKDDKVIEGCCAYITAEARKKAVKGCAVIEDAEVFGWAMHYIDEDIKAPADAPKARVETAPTADVPKKAVSAPVAKPKEKKADECQLSLF